MIMMNARISREKKTISAMIEMYCSHFHSEGSTLCLECNRMLTYALGRMDRCSYHELKPVCSNCRIHCYEKEMRETIKRVMRYSGPRMILHHPILAVAHLLHRLQRYPVAKRP